MQYRSIIKILIRLFLGLFLYAVGIVMTINANLGLAPWDIFHQGITLKLGITMGQASIGAGLVIIIFNSLLREKLGWGTLCNMYFIGIFMDFLMLNNLIPIFDNIFLQLLMLCLGMFLIGVASYYYIGVGLGAGPRDGLMVVLTKITNKSVRFNRNAIEISVLIMGYFLGGFLGMGTVIVALTIGYFVQFAFKLYKFDVAAVEHRFIGDDIKWIKNQFQKKNTMRPEK